MLDAKRFKDAVATQDVLNAYNEFLGILESITDGLKDMDLQKGTGDLQEMASTQNRLRSTCKSVYEAIGGMDKDVLFEQIDKVEALVRILEEGSRTG